MTQPVGTLAPQDMVRTSYLEAIVQAQIEEMECDEHVVMLGEDIAVYGDGKIIETFGGSRVWSTPISENSFCGIAIGAAMTGLRPIVNLNIASFVYLPSDQIINQAAKLHYMTGGQMKVPAGFRCVMFYSAGNAAQHSDRPYPLFMNPPGLKVIAPSGPADAKGLIKSAIRDDDPVFVFEDSTLWPTKEPVSMDPDVLIPIGKADVKRQGKDVTVIAVAGSNRPSLKAADMLSKKGISVEVVDPRTLVPLDKETLLSSVAKTGRVVIADPAHRTCSAASEIAAIIAEEGFGSLKAPVQRVTTPDVHVPFSPALEKLIYPTKDTIIEAVEAVLYQEYSS